MQGLVRFMLNLTSSMLETITTEAGQDPVMRCVELGGEESWWGEKVEVLCLLSMCKRAVDIRVLQDSTIEPLETPDQQGGFSGQAGTGAPVLFGPR